MAILQFGFLIKKRREDLGLTQEDLADGICAVPTLSRIENGERLPNNNNLEVLLQRLGYSSNNVNSFVSERDFVIHEKKFEIRQAYMTKQFSLAKELVVEYELLLERNDAINKQFLILYQTLLAQEHLSNKDKLERYEAAIRLTCPSYGNKKIPHVLSYEEIILLNAIATCYDYEGKRNHAIDILFGLKDYYDNRVVNMEEALRTQPLILYNLSKMLGLEGRYDECIDICNLGIRVAKATGRCALLDKTLYNRAWALVKRGQEEDRIAAKHNAKQAYYFAEMVGYKQNAEAYRKFILNEFSEEVSL